MSILKNWKARAGQLKLELLVLYAASRDPRVPWYAKAFILAIVGYAFSPIDLIPDPIPVLGYLDDLILIPLGIALALKLIPEPILNEHRARVQEAYAEDRSTHWIAVSLIVATWVLIVVVAVFLALAIT